MSLSPAFLDELRARTHLSSLLARSLKLTKAGREFKACCPFHSEKTPSFYVNDEKGFYHCFGCQAHGDAIRWLTDAKGLAFMDAVKELADAAGMEVPAPDPRARERFERQAGLYEVMEAAQAWFVEQLNGIEGNAARDYLKGRGIDPATRERFGFGFAPDSRGKLKAALDRFGQEKLVEAGLLIQPDEDEREPYDRFRGRLTFPIRDPRGRVIAFSARILGAGEPKYLNSPDTPLFDKGRTLFNHDLAAAASRAAKRVIVVEGQMDVIALHQAGIPECVAPLGTSITETQIQLLWRLSDRPIFCFDGDTAGQKASARAARRALPLVETGRSIGFVTMPPGKDPDDLVKEGGTAALLGFLASPEPLVERIWRAEIDESDVGTPEGRAGIKQRLDELARSIHNSYVRDEYKHTFRDIFWERLGWRKREVQRISTDIAASRKQGRSTDKVLMRAVLLGLSRYPDVLRDNMDLALNLELADDHQRDWLDCLSEAIYERPSLDEDLVNQILDANVVPPVEQRNLWKDLGFSFFYRRDPDRGRRDLKEVLVTLAAERDVARAMEEANARVRQALETPEWELQQRLLHQQLAHRQDLRALAERMAQEWEQTEQEKRSARR